MRSRQCKACSERTVCCDRCKSASERTAHSRQIPSYARSTESSKLVLYTAAAPMQCTFCVLQADAELHEEEEEQRYSSCTPLPAPSDVHGLEAFLAAARPDPALCTPAAVLASCQVRMHIRTEYRSKFNTFCLLWLLPSCQVIPGCGVQL